MKQVWIWISLSLALTTPSFAASYETERWFTKNKTAVIFYEAKEVPMLQVNIAFRAGSAYDGPAFGLASLTGKLLNQGNNGLSADEIAEQFADTGAQFSVNTSRDMTLLSLTTLTDDKLLANAIQLLSTVLTHPDFPNKAFIREKNQQLLAITQTKESPGRVANDVFFEALYPNHPYGHPVMGTKETVSSLTTEQVRQFYQRYYVSGNAIIVLVGAITKQKAHQLAETLTASLPIGPKAPATPLAQPLKKTHYLPIDFPSSQTVLRIGELGITHHNVDYFPLLVGNYILGGGTLVSQLAIELREKRGLTYGVGSQFVAMPGRGPFIISLSTKQSQAPIAAELVRKTLSAFIKKGPTADELTAAKDYLIGSFPLSLASNSDIAQMLVNIAFYDLPDDFLKTYVNKINTVTSTSIQQAFKHHLHPEKLLEVRVGKK